MKVQNQLLKDVNQNERLNKGKRKEAGDGAATVDADEQTEEMLLAFELLNKYKKDKNFIDK